MQFAYNPRKAAQAAAYIVSLNSGRINSVSLMKLLYLADRKALSQRGRPITGDNIVAMPHGPVLNRIYDLMSVGTHPDFEPWDEYLTEREPKDICLRRTSPPTDELSDFERATLEETFQQYAQMDPAALCRITRELPEYQDPQGSSLPIDPVRILQEAGWGEVDIQEALMNARQEVFMNSIAGRG